MGTPWELLQRERLRRRNAYLRDIPGDNARAAIFTLSCGGRVRFEGDEDWTPPGGSLDPQKLRLPVVALDLSGTCVTYEGLDNLVSLPQLQLLDLSGCPHVTDWALGRLQAFGATLRELSVAKCPQVTQRGLAALHPLRGLRRLDVTGIPVSSPGLVRILLEEALPGCHIQGLELGTLETPPPPPP
ncbi:LOW QUALITY PROTEIN: distal membrane-arm assembly complex protein 2 [Heliangelus exortis]|uniref:LOW QUALITY PROTEIN: distal membrane-arm assembly complex protein 2 n=1 Tax=Heliangelus exortis TaxID=472823 RepID=UPI003A9283AC